MKKVTYYMYSCDTCCKIRDMMEMDDLDSAKCQKSRKGTDGININVNENKDKTTNSHLLPFKPKTCSDWRKMGSELGL